LKGSIDITKEDNEIIKRGVESGVSAVQQIKQAVPGPEPEPGLGSRGGKHKSRRVTKHKRK
ncbi:MAG: hypothetical protein EBU93_06440, partial [Chlamydiae bacterium]|nr:hypothetical protein [Chlamydiota bacterium]